VAHMEMIGEHDRVIIPIENSRGAESLPCLFFVRGISHNVIHAAFSVSRWSVMERRETSIASGRCRVWVYYASI